MSDWLLNLPVVWMAVVIFGAAYLLALIFVIVTTIRLRETIETI